MGGKSERGSIVGCIELRDVRRDGRAVEVSPCWCSVQCDGRVLFNVQCPRTKSVTAKVAVAQCGVTRAMS